MNWFKNRNIATKLASSFLVVIALSAAVGGFAIAELGSVNDRVDVLAKDALPGITKASEIGETAAQMRRYVLNVLLATSAADRATARQRVDAEVVALTAQLTTYRALIARPDVQAVFAEL